MRGGTKRHRCLTRIACLQRIPVVFEIAVPFVVSHLSTARGVARSSEGGHLGRAR